MLVDQIMPREVEALEAIRGATTVLISDVKTYIGHTIARSLIEDRYQLIDEKILPGNRYAIFAHP
jgi:hypothetical protein